ncbi:MAG: hypothetical protein U0893_28710 [Chloroflexota bacterium]
MPTARPVVGLPIPAPPAFRGGLPAPPLRALRLSFRELLAGTRSPIFIGLMLMRMIFVIVQTIWLARSPIYAVIGAGIFMTAILISSPKKRLRAPAMGIFCAFIWSYALADRGSLGTPALQYWPLLVVIGLLAGLTEWVYGHVDPSLYFTSVSELDPPSVNFVYVAVALQAFSALLFVVPIFTVAVLSIMNFTNGEHELYELVPFAASVPTFAGLVIYSIFVMRRLRALAKAPTRIQPT